MTRQFWKSSGFHLLERDPQGWLRVTPDFLRAYYTRPEIHPVAESCAAEHALFDRLMETPDAPVSEADLAALADPDARDNYRLVLAFRDHLLTHGTLETAYLRLFDGTLALPPVFLDQMVHAILRGILDDCAEPLMLRAAELFFREQTAQVGEDLCMLADAETVAMRAGSATLHVPEARPREAEIDILTEETAAEYWARSERFDTALDFRFTQPGPDALARVISLWIAHFHGLDTRIQAMASIRDTGWRWHVGLDSAATGILNALYRGDAVHPDTLWQMIALYRMEFTDPGRIDPAQGTRPVYLGAAVTPDLRLRLKPQNLLTNLPLREGRAA